MANCALLLNDGSFLLLNDSASILLLNDDSCGEAPTEPDNPGIPSVPVDVVTDPGGAGGALAWRRRHQEHETEKRRRAALLALIRQSDDYKRLKRKLAMLQEHLLDAVGRVETVTVKDKIAEIEAQIEMMERLE
jgi:hypothetical protein